MRKGVEQTVKVTLGRLEDGEKLADAQDGKQDDTDQGDAGKAVSTAKVLGMTVGELERRVAQEVRASPGTSPAWWSPRLPRTRRPPSAASQAGEVITEIAQESVSSPKEVMDRIAALKDQGRKNALLMLASKTGELRFVTIRMD